MLLSSTELETSSMPTALKQEPPSTSFTATTGSTEFLLAASAVRSDDRVVVAGQRSFDHLLGLVRSGCNSAATVRSHTLRRGEDDADVIWFTGVGSIDAEISASVERLDTPRVVAFELTQDNAKVGLPSVLGRLRAKGLVDQSVVKAGGRTIVVASRPAWLQRVI
jgi:hypothetical protein